MKKFIAVRLFLAVFVLSTINLQAVVFENCTAGRVLVVQKKSGNVLAQKVIWKKLFPPSVAKGAEDWENGITTNSDCKSSVGVQTEGCYYEFYGVDMISGIFGTNKKFATSSFIGRVSATAFSGAYGQFSPSKPLVTIKLLKDKTLKFVGTRETKDVSLVKLDEDLVDGSTHSPLRLDLATPKDTSQAALAKFRAIPYA
jgi:hypothetical protein